MLRCNGRVLEVREVGLVISRLAARNGPIKLHGTFLLDDEQADEWIEQLTRAQADKTLWAPKE